MKTLKSLAVATLIALGVVSTSEAAINVMYKGRYMDYSDAGSLFIKETSKMKSYAQIDTYAAKVFKGSSCGMVSAALDYAANNSRNQLVRNWSAHVVNQFNQTCAELQ